MRAGTGRKQAGGEIERRRFGLMGRLLNRPKSDAEFELQPLLSPTAKCRRYPPAWRRSPARRLGPKTRAPARSSYTAIGIAPCVFPVRLPASSTDASPQAPEITSMYALSVSPAYVRHALRQRFERQRTLQTPVRSTCYCSRAAKTTRRR